MRQGLIGILIHEEMAAAHRDMIAYPGQPWGPDALHVKHPVHNAV